jgi:Cu+-exporting ATPase
MPCGRQDWANGAAFFLSFRPALKETGGALVMKWMRGQEERASAGVLVAPEGLPAAGREAGVARSEAACFHCGLPCAADTVVEGNKHFCCRGCLTVHGLLSANGLGHFYDLSRHPGVRREGAETANHWSFLDTPAVRERLVDFTDGQVSRVTFQVPAMHCIACVWLLENLFRLHPGIGQSHANFVRREVSITFADSQVRLSEVAALLASLGYPPQLTLQELERAVPDAAGRQRALQVGVAGFAFGNVMLFSLPVYLGLDTATEPVLRVVFGYLSLLLALPVLVFSAADYWRSAWSSLRQRRLTLEVPIALGLAALYAQSAFEISSGRGEGYLDSLCGLVFFLLLGRIFQQKTHDRLAFDRDYRSFFPLAVLRCAERGEESVSVSELQVGDRLRLRHGELVPADARLVTGEALIDYSFVTGESEPVPRRAGDLIYAGGQQMGGTIKVETIKPVSESYLTSLWNHQAFKKRRGDELDTLTNRYSQRFTLIVVGIALGAALGWGMAGDPGRAVKAFVSVLIVACPCALALAAPFALGTAHRWLGRTGVFVKDTTAIERLARVDTVVLDKTGTLTQASVCGVDFMGERLRPDERDWVAALTESSIHPYSRCIHESLRTEGTVGAVAERAGQGIAAGRVIEGDGRRLASGRWVADEADAGRGATGRRPSFKLEVTGFRERAGLGLAGRVMGREVLLGSKDLLAEAGILVGEQDGTVGSAVHLAMDGQWRGVFVVFNPLRPEVGRLVERLRGRYDLALISGDRERERSRFQLLFGSDTQLRFEQSPHDKLEFIQAQQRRGRTVMMVGDGLNDAGALRQSEVGVAVTERVGAFSPASDVILEAVRVPLLAEVLEFARRTVRVVRVSFGISAVYNAVGVSIAAAALLSPLVCAVLMPLSSVSVVAFACWATRVAARRSRLPVAAKASDAASSEGGAVAWA